jgi:DNA-binding transcriptional LysR family regulator
VTSRTCQLEPVSARGLAAFVAAVETGSIQDAAAALMLTQSAATKRIQSLERSLGAQLLVRSRSGVRPTQIGRVLYPDAKEVLSALGRAQRNVRVATGRRDGMLSIAASHTIGEELLPGWLAAFRAREPDIRAEVDVVNSTTVLERLRAHDLDVGFVEGTDELMDLERLPLGTDELVVVVAAGHRWGRRRSVLPRELLAEPFYARESGSGSLAVAQQQLAAHGVLLRPSVQMANIASLKAVVRTGGFALMSRRSIQGEVEAGLLASRQIAGVALRRQLVAVRRGAPPRPSASARFWRWLQLFRSGMQEGET